MKHVLSILMFFIALDGLAQVPDPLEVRKIVDEIAMPMGSNASEQFLARVVFPFKVSSDAGTKVYAKTELKSSFNAIFADGTAACLMDEGSYQLALPDDQTEFLAVCFEAPEGYEVSVFVFRKKEGTWMLAGLDLQPE